MNNIKILTATLLASTLTLSAFNVQTVQHKVQLKINSISLLVAKILQQRGIDEKASKDIANNFFQKNEILAGFMVQNLEQGSSIFNEKNILEYLSTQALYKKSFELDSYSALVSMAQSISGHDLSETILKELENIALINSLYKRAVA